MYDVYTHTYVYMYKIYTSTHDLYHMYVCMYVYIYICKYTHVYSQQTLLKLLRLLDLHDWGHVVLDWSMGQIGRMTRQDIA